ncbi:hypothetical protein AAE478_002757 [Parahypoxylon ruwenzoriense]
MSTIAARVELAGHRALFHAPPGGTPSRIISFHLNRHSQATPHVYGRDASLWGNLYHPTRGVATAVRPSVELISDLELALFRDLLNHSGSRSGDTAAGGPSLDVANTRAGTRDAKSSVGDLLEQLPSPFQRALKALQQRDTRRLLIYLRQICSMEESDLHHAVATLPRTTFTEFLRSLDPLRVARDADPTDQAHISVGILQTLNMESTIDDWGVRKIYLRLLRRVLTLIMALKASGQVLQTEEYIYLLRCAGAASDPAGAKWIWREMDRTQTTEWRQSDAYAEFISARFLTRPLYTGYDKTRRMVLPRNLHRSRLKLSKQRVYKLDRLRFNTRLGKLRFGLNKDVDYAEDIMRMMRKRGAPSRLFHRVLQAGHRLTEPLLCALMVGFGRVGSLRFVATRILEDYFGIQMTQLTYKEGVDIRSAPRDPNRINRVAHRVRPTLHLMQAIVETYGSNGEIALAFQLVDFVSKTYHIDIPLSVWQDLLEWTYIMGAPPASTAWKLAGLPSKVPGPAAVELIWNTMTSEPYGVRPGFEQYAVLIRGLLGRHHFSRALPYMRDAARLYHAQSTSFEDLALQHVQALRDGVPLRGASHAYERARFRKEHMWYGLNTWCRQLLSKTRSYSASSSAAPSHVLIPDFVREFRAFLPNPAQYRTPTGYASLLDPARETPRRVYVRDVPMAVPMRERGEYVYRRVKARRLAVVSSHSLARRPTSKLDPLALLVGDLPTFRRLRPEHILAGVSESQPATESHVSPGKSSKPAPQTSSYDDDDDYF